MHLAKQHLDEINQWGNDIPQMKIGGRIFGGFSPNVFLSSYVSNWELKHTEKSMKQNSKKKVNFSYSSYINYCNTNAFFLTPLKKKSVIQKGKIDFKSICKML